MRFQKICVLGLGYIGLPTASTFATHGLQVIGVDVNPAGGRHPAATASCTSTSPACAPWCRRPFARAT